LFLLQLGHPFLTLFFETFDLFTDKK
jgi:hypothetical protein